MLEGQEQRQAITGGTDRLRSPRDFNRDALLDLVAHASLANMDNWCFANSSVHSLLWTTLSVMDFDSSFWGKHCNTLHDFVFKLDQQTGYLSQEPWLNQVMQCWGRHASGKSGHVSQQDAAEFVGSWLESMQSTAFNMRWERRLEAEDTTHMVDESVSTFPLFLQFAPIHTHLPRCALSDLIQVWHLADGMRAALTSSTLCLCVHIDRCFQAPGSAVGKCKTVIDTEVDCLVPIFLGDTLQSGLIEYTIVALQAHLGGDAHGHYRTALRINPTVTQGPAPSSWLLCDDWQKPAPVWSLPDWFHQNVTVIWLTRNDSLALHAYADPVQMEPGPDSVAAMLALLKPLDPPA